MKWLIIFPNSWPSYSPSLINFVKMIERNGGQSIIVYLEDDYFDNSEMKMPCYPVLLNTFLIKITKRLRLISFYKILMLFIISFKFHLKQKFTHIVGIDDCGFIAAYLINKKAVYYSLEISKSRLNNFIFSKLSPNLLIIQSIERKNYLCKSEINTVYIQNSCLYNPEDAKIKSYTGKLIYFGHISNTHGVEICIRSLYSLDKESLTIKGLKSQDSKYIDYLKIQYRDLLEMNRLVFDFSYIDNNDVVNYLQNYDIGFCLYDFSLIDINDFNYISSPSGKQFNYFAAGLPVIASDSIGLSPVTSFNAGIAIKYPNNSEIKKAIDIISKNYNVFRSNALLAAEELDYARMFEMNKNKIIPPPRKKLIRSVISAPYIWQKAA